MASRRDRYGSAGLAVSAALLTVRMAGATRSSRTSSLSGQGLPAGRLVTARVQERTVAGVGRPDQRANQQANQRRADMGTLSVGLPGACPARRAETPARGGNQSRLRSS